MARVDDMSRRGEAVDRHRQRQPVARADESDEMILPQRFGAQGANTGKRRRDGEVEFAGRELIVQSFALDRPDLNVEPRSVAPKRCDEGWQEGGLVQIDGRDPRRGDDLPRVENAGQAQRARNVG